MSKIAIIPARSGSKGLPDKNIKMLNGKPMMAYSIEAAFNSNEFDCVHVSTDDERYADIARKYGADVPFLRTPELSSDCASSWDMVRFVLEQYQKCGKYFEWVMLLQPTSPLRDHEDIKAIICTQKRKKAETVVSVCEMEHSPLWCNVLPENGSMKDFLYDKAKVNRQSIPTYYRINGAMYYVKSELVLTGRDIYCSDIYAHIMDKTKSIDVDDILDFQMAELLMTLKTTEI